MGRMKPRIEGETDSFLRWGDPRPFLVRTRWLISCPCMTTRYLAVVSTWEAALEIALLHGRALHGDT